MKQSIIQYILPALLVLSGTIAGIYISAQLNKEDWKERTQFEGSNKLLSERLNLMERTSKVIARMPEAFSLFSSLEDSTNPLTRDHLLAYAKQLADIRSELWSVMLLNQIYFGDSTRNKINEIFIQRKDTTWWNLDEARYNEIVKVMGKELHPDSSRSTVYPITEKVEKRAWRDGLIGGVIGSGISILLAILFNWLLLKFYYWNITGRYFHAHGSEINIQHRFGRRFFVEGKDGENQYWKGSYEAISPSLLHGSFDYNYEHNVHKPDWGEHIIRLQLNRKTIFVSGVNKVTNEQFASFTATKKK